MVERNSLVTPDKKKIAYCHYREKHDKVVIIAHGFYNSKDAVLLENLAKALKEEYDIFLFDFRGHGKSSGVFTWISKEEVDLETVLDFLKSKYKKIGIIAFSLGGSISINTLARRTEVDSLICVSAPSEFEKIDYKIWKLNWEEDVVYTLFSKEGKKGKGMRPGPFWLKKKKPYDSAKSIKTPVLYIHGDKDWVIAPWHSRALFDKTRAKKKLIMIKDGSHAEYLMRNHRTEFLKEIKAWFEDTLN